MVKYRIDRHSYIIEKVEIDRESDKSVFIGNKRFSIINYFDSREEAKACLDIRYSYSLRNTVDTYVIVKDLGLCGFELYDKKSKKMKSCGISGCVVSQGKHLCIDHFKAGMVISKKWNMFDIKEDKIITINRFLEEIKKGGLCD